MTTLPPLTDVATTRSTLHELAEQTMAATQMEAIGTIRLQVTPGGFATRWFPGPDGSQIRLRVDGDQLITDPLAEAAPIDGPIDLAAAAVLTAWWELGDAVLSALEAGSGEELSELVLWPEHFDVAVTLTSVTGRHVNLGFSPGDEFSPEPYVYAGPWEAFEGEFWNAPFGAYRTYSQIAPSDDAFTAAMAFLTEAREVYR